MDVKHITNQILALQGGKQLVSNCFTLLETAHILELIRTDPRTNMIGWGRKKSASGNGCQSSSPCPVTLL